MSLTFTPSRQGLMVYSDQLATDATNLAAAGAVAGKKSDRPAFASFMDTDTSMVETVKIRHLSGVGVPIASQEQTNFSIAGQGWAAVSDKATAGEVGFSRNCTFKIDGNKNFTNNEGRYLQVFLTNADGTPNVGDVSSTANLTTLNVDGLSQAAQASTRGSLSLQLPFSATVGQTLPADQTLGFFQSSGIKEHLSSSWTKVGGPFQDLAATQAWTLTLTGSGGTTVNAPYSAGMRIEFDGNGLPVLFDAGGSNSTTAPALNITWGNGAAPSTIALDLGTAGTNTGIICSGESLKIKSFLPDGYEGGDFKKINFDENGFGIVTFSNNQTLKYCRVPLGICNNVDALKDMKPGMLTAINRADGTGSGEMVLYFPGESGAGLLAAGTYEGSTSYSPDVLIDAIDHQKKFLANLDPIKKTESAYDSLLQII